MNPTLDYLNKSISLVTFYLNYANSKLSAITDIYNNDVLREEVKDLETTLECLTKIKNNILEESNKSKAMSKKLEQTYVHQHITDRMNQVT